MLKFLSGVAVGLAGFYLWSGWPLSYDARVNRLVTYVERSPIALFGPDTWLMDTALGQTFPTALIFGYPDNLALCDELTETLNSPGTPQLFCSEAAR